MLGSTCPLPTSRPERSRELVDSLLAPAVEHGVERVAFVAYTEDAVLAARVGARLRASFTRHGIGVIDVLRADDGCWTCVPTRSGRREKALRPYDDRSHPFAAQAVFDGRVTHATRDDLRTALAADPDQRRHVLRAQLALPPPGPDEAALVLDLVARCVARGQPPDDEEAARVLRAVTDVAVRDAALFAVRADTAVEHLDALVLAPAAGARDPGAGHGGGHGVQRLAGRPRCPRLVRSRPLLRDRPRAPARSGAGRVPGARRAPDGMERGERSDRMPSQALPERARSALR